MYTTMSSVTPWSSTVQYGVIKYNAIPVNPAISGMINIQSLVSHNNVLYLCDKGVTPTINVAPPLQPEAWTQIGVVSTTTVSYANISAIGRATNVLAGGDSVFDLLGARKANSTDISYVLGGESINLPLNKVFTTVFTVGITAAAGATGSLAITGTNCTVNANSVALIANTTLLYTCSAVITTTNTALPTISFTRTGISGTVTQASEGNFLLTSVS